MNATSDKHKVVWVNIVGKYVFWSQISSTMFTKHRPKTDFHLGLNPGLMTGIPVPKPLRHISDKRRKVIRGNGKIDYDKPGFDPGWKLVFLIPTYTFGLCFVNI